MAALFNVKSFQIVPDCSLSSIQHQFESKFVEPLRPYDEIANKHRDPLAQACRYDNTERLERALQETNVNPVKNLVRLTEVAAEQGHVKVVKFLVDKVRISITNEGGDLSVMDLGNALHSAAYSGHVAVVQYLIDSDLVRAGAYDNLGNSSLHIAAARGHLPVIKELCLRNRQFLKYFNHSGFAALHLAVIFSKTNVLEYLLEEGELCSPTQKTKRGSTILHIACEINRRDIVDYLVTQVGSGDMLLTEDADGYRPIHIAVMKGHVSLVKYIVRMMTSSGHSPNGKGSSGWTPLHCAAELGNLELVKLFCAMESFITKECLGPGNISPLHIAALSGKKPVMEFLLKGGHFLPDNVCSVFVLSNSLHLAAFHGHVNCCQLLIDDYNLDPLVRTASGSTSIHIAAGAGNVSVLRYLVQTKDHSPNITMPLTNATPLHIAAASGKVKALEWLLTTTMCNPNVQMSLNKVTALHLAVMEGNMEAVKLLAAHKRCDVNLKAILGMTPICFAEKTSLCWELIKNGAVPFQKISQLPSEFRFLQTWSPVLPSVRLCVIGHSGAGKTSLVQALQTEGKWLARPITDVQLHTAGIIPVDFESMNFGKVTVYDFAGHKEYYASHEAMLEKSGAIHPIFLIVVDLRQSDEEVCESVRYWKAFVKNATKSSYGITRIIVVGSHLDLLSSSLQQEKVQVLSSLTDGDSIDFVKMDCRRPTSAGMSQLRKSLNQLCVPLRSSLRVHRHCHAFASFLEFMRRYQPCIAYSVHDIREAVGKYGAPVTDFLHELPDLLRSLSNAGFLLYLKHDRVVDEGWVVFDQKTILEKVHGYQNVIEEKLKVKKEKVSGVLNLKQIGQLFDIPGITVYALVHYLVHMEFCYTIKDAKLLHMLNSSSASPSNVLQPIETHHFFFPDLLLNDPIGDAMLPSADQDCSMFGWCLRSRDPGDYITSRFVQTFLPQAAFSLSLSTAIVATDTVIEIEQLNTCLWKRGISWSLMGVNCTIMLADDHSIVVVCHCKKGNEMELVYQRTRIIREVYELTKKYFEESMKLEEFIISPDSLRAALQNYRDASVQQSVKCFFHPEMKVCSLVDVHSILFNQGVRTPRAHCINLCRLRDLEYRGMGQIHIDDLLMFEPFSLVKGSHLAQMFSACHEEMVTETWMCEGIAEFSSDRWEKLAKVVAASSPVFNSCFKEATSADSCMKLYSEHLQNQCTFQTLSTQFNQYSIFFGRSIEVSGRFAQ